MVKVNWTPIAVEDLKKVYDYISLDSARYAQITVTKIHFRVQNLSDQPLSGRKVPEFDDSSIREVISGNYRIIYLLKGDDSLDIVRIFHSARKLDKDKLK
jgi:toxin ParE1/3/4